MSLPATDAVPAAVLPVALDAMGGDRAPREPVAGAVRAVRELGIPVALVGRQAELDALVGGLGGPFARLSIVDAPDIVGMDEHAVAAVRHKPANSISVAMGEVRDGRACAAVSAGHSGAVVAAALFTLGRLTEVERPGIGVVFPTSAGGRVLLIDAGAVVDARPQYLVQFATLATIYLRHVDGIANPRVGLLSNGEEPGKGNALVRETFERLAAAPTVNFMGNVEGNSIASGNVDAVVCDGFTGNVVLKTAEGVVGLVQESLRAELGARWHRRLLAAPLRGALRGAARRLDYREYGGAPLLGVRGVVMIAHGRSDSTAIRNAVAGAFRAAQHDLTGALTRGLANADPATPTSPGESVMGA